MIKVIFSNQTVKRLKGELQRAYTRGDLCGVRHLSVLTISSEGKDNDLVPANLDEHLAAKTIIDHFFYCDLFTDKGFLSMEWQTLIFDQTNNLIWSPRRSNQYVQNTRNLDHWLSSVRERTEGGVFHEIQKTGKNIERLLAKTIIGLCTRVIANMTSHLLRHLLLIDFGVNVQTFEVFSTS